MKPECKTLLKVFEIVSNIHVNKYDDDYPEILSYLYLVLRGYWKINDETGETIEVAKPPFSTVSLLNAMITITNELRNSKTIEDIVSERELCSDSEQI